MCGFAPHFCIAMCIFKTARPKYHIRIIFIATAYSAIRHALYDSIMPASPIILYIVWETLWCSPLFTFSGITYCLSVKKIKWWNWKLSLSKWYCVISIYVHNFFKNGQCPKCLRKGLKYKFLKTFKFKVEMVYFGIYRGGGLAANLVNHKPL